MANSVSVMENTTGEVVAANVRRVRSRRELSLRDLAALLAALGHPISVSAISKVENGDRRVDVDDLVALAIAMNVSPLTLLLPAGRGPSDNTRVGNAVRPAWRLWEWALGDVPLDMSADLEEGGEQIYAFRELSTPWWLKVEVEVPLHGDTDPERARPAPLVTDKLMDFLHYETLRPAEHREISKADG